METAAMEKAAMEKAAMETAAMETAAMEKAAMVVVMAVATMRRSSHQASLPADTDASPCPTSALTHTNVKVARCCHCRRRSTQYSRI